MVICFQSDLVVHSLTVFWITITDLTKEEAIELGKRAIVHATHRDAYSGGTNNVYYVGPDGWEKVWSGDTTDQFYGYYPTGKIGVEGESKNLNKKFEGGDTFDKSGL